MSKQKVFGSIVTKNKHIDDFRALILRLNRHSFIDA